MKNESSNHIRNSSSVLKPLQETSFLDINSDFKPAGGVILKNLEGQTLSRGQDFTSS